MLLDHESNSHEIIKKIVVQAGEAASGSLVFYTYIRSNCEISQEIITQAVTPMDRDIFIVGQFKSLAFLQPILHKDYRVSYRQYFYCIKVIYTGRKDQGSQVKLFKLFRSYQGCFVLCDKAITVPKSLRRLDIG